MGKVISSHKRILIFVLMLMVMLVNLARWGGRKEGYHGDEILTYTFICQVDGDHSMNVDRDGVSYLNTWHDAEYLMQFLTLSEDEKFDFAGTYRSSVQDVHPPVYYLLFEAFCSLISMGFCSKWAGIGFNMILFTITMIMVYLLAGKLFGRSGDAEEKRCCVDAKVLYACGLYGFSVGAVSTVMLVRMYMQLTLCVVLFCLAEVRVWEHIAKTGTGNAAFAAGKAEGKNAASAAGKAEGKNAGGKSLVSVYGPLFLATVFGFLTQYYFIIFAFFMSLVIWGFILYLKKFADAVSYAAAMGAGIIVSVLLYPEVYNDLFRDYRGVEAWSNAGVMNGWVSDVLSYVKIVNNELLGGYLKLMILLLALAFVVTVLVKLFVRSFRLDAEGLYVRLGYQKPEFSEKEVSLSVSALILWQFVFAAACYIAVVAKVAPTMNDRYIFAMYPVIAIVLTALLWLIISSVKTEKPQVKWMKAAVIVLVSLLCLMGYKREGVQFLYKGETAKRAVMREYSGCPAILVTKQNTRGVTTKMSPYLINQPEFYPVDESGIDGIGAALSDKADRKGVIVYIDLEYENPDETLELVLSQLHKSEAKLIVDTNVANIYYVGL